MQKARVSGVSMFRLQQITKSVNSATRAKTLFPFFRLLGYLYFTGHSSLHTIIITNTLGNQHTASKQ